MHNKAQGCVALDATLGKPPAPVHLPRRGSITSAAWPVMEPLRSNSLLCGLLPGVACAALRQPRALICIPFGENRSRTSRCFHIREITIAGFPSACPVGPTVLGER